MDLNLKNKIVVITGLAGKKGSIGETIVNHVVEEGGIPVLIDRNDRGLEMEKMLHEKGVDALFAQADLTNHEACKLAVDKVSAKYGRIDVLINNVGVNDGVNLESTYEEFMASLKLNLVSFFLITKYSLPLLKSVKGNIINIGSKVSFTGQGGTSGYAAAKGGVTGLTREWAVDLLAFGIRVNAVIIAESWINRKKNDPNFPLVWQWNHNPDNDLWEVNGKKGYLRLTTGRVDSSIVDARNTLTQRTFGPVSSANTLMDVSYMKDGDFAGLTLLQLRYGMVGVKKEDGASYILMVKNESNEDEPVEVERIPLNQDKVYQKAAGDFEERRDIGSFYYSLDGESWTQIGNNLQMRYTLPHFMGYRFGLFNYATRQAGGNVDFDYFPDNRSNQ